MANFEALKTLIRQYIKENGDGEITGDILQSVLIAMVTEVEGNGYVYAGIATPTTVPVTGNVFYIATEAGSYSNFGSVDVSAGITILKRDGTSWIKNQISYTDGVFDISAYNGSSYANLTAALGTNGANVPLAVRKGGMSVKFVSTSDNNYVQFRYMSSSIAVADFTNVVNWQEEKDKTLSTTNKGFFLLDNYLNVGLKYDKNGLDAAEVSQHFIELLKPLIGNNNVSEKGFFLVDKRLNTIIKYDENGLDVDKLSQHFIELLITVTNLYFCNVTSEKGFFFVDKHLNIGVKIDSKGVQAKNIFDCEIVNV